jgi:hypothetical protein
MKPDTVESGNLSLLHCKSGELLEKQYLKITLYVCFEEIYNRFRKKFWRAGYHNLSISGIASTFTVPYTQGIA